MPDFSAETTGEDGPSRAAPAARPRPKSAFGGPGGMMMFDPSKVQLRSAAARGSLHLPNSSDAVLPSRPEPEPVAPAVTEAPVGSDLPPPKMAFPAPPMGDSQSQTRRQGPPSITQVEQKRQTTVGKLLTSFLSKRPSRSALVADGILKADELTEVEAIPAPKADESQAVLESRRPKVVPGKNCNEARCKKKIKSKKVSPFGRPDGFKSLIHFPGGALPALWKGVLQNVLAL